METLFVKVMDTSGKYQYLNLNAAQGYETGKYTDARYNKNTGKYNKATTGEAIRVFFESFDVRCWRSENPGLEKLLTEKTIDLTKPENNGEIKW